MFNDEERERLVELAELYIQAKALIIYAEEVDPESRSNIQIVKELRDAFDHVMRVVVARSSSGSPHANEEGYGEKNLHKAIGHVYRATFDALDGTVVSLKEKLVELLDPYPLEVIKTVIPDYWEQRGKIERLSERIADHRASKDVGDNVGEVLDAYMDDVEALKGFHKKVLASMCALDECKARQGRERRFSILENILIGLVIALIAGIVGWLLRGGEADSSFGSAHAPQQQGHPTLRHQHSDKTTSAVLPETILSTCGPRTATQPSSHDHKGRQGTCPQSGDD